MTPAESLAYALDPELLFEKIVGPCDDWQRDLLLASATERRILACCGRQTGKSAVVSVLAARHALFNPASLTVVASGSLTQSQELGRRIFAGIKVLEPEVRQENLTKVELFNRSRVICLPQSEHVRGLSKVSLVIADEAQDVEASFFASLTPMQATVKNPLLVVLGTTKARTGAFWEYYSGGNFKVFEVRSDQCPRISKQFLADQLATLGPLLYGAEYENKWMDDATQIISDDLLLAAVDHDYVPASCLEK